MITQYQPTSQYNLLINNITSSKKLKVYFWRNKIIKEHYISISSLIKEAKYKLARRNFLSIYICGCFCHSFCIKCRCFNYYVISVKKDLYNYVTYTIINGCIYFCSKQKCTKDFTSVPKNDNILENKLAYIILCMCY